MPGFFDGGRSGGSRGGSKFGRPAGRDFRRDGDAPQMHQATCDDCGNSCEVPFRPTGERPVYCSNCFKKHRPEDSERSGSSNRGTGVWRSEDRPMFSAKCDRCGNSCEVPFRPTGERPVYCSKCFGEGGGSSSSAPTRSSRPAENYGAQFAVLGTKLDEILKVLKAAHPVQAPVVAKAPASAPVVAKPVEKAKKVVAVKAKKVAKKKSGKK